MIGYLNRKGYLPGILFCFSRSQCEVLANGATGLNLIDSQHKSIIHAFIKKTLNRLKVIHSLSTFIYKGER
jgi:antiviral helicase SKI2